MRRDEWLDLARKLDWNYSYVKEEEVFPAQISGTPWLPHNSWKQWDEPYRTSYAEYVSNQYNKDLAVNAVRETLGRIKDFQQLDPLWVNGLKLYAATFSLAEFAATIGNLRAARFGRDSAWRTMASFGAMDEFRHTQIPLLLMHELLRWDPQFDWTHKFYHSNNWVAIAARHFADELLLTSNPIEFAIATNFVFETGFTNLQFIGLSSQAEKVGDRMFERMIQSIQTDEARHAQIGRPVLAVIAEQDREYAQYLLDKWFWRSWLLIAVVTGFTMDYLTPVEKRSYSFKEFMEEWILTHFLSNLKEFGLKKPWYWDKFLDSLDIYHHMVYASAYSYRATVWFNLAMPGPKERAWLKRKYPKYWNQMDAVWERTAQRWANTDPGVEFGVHGTSIVSFCNLCQIVLCGGTPEKNHANSLIYEGQPYIFCSDVCRWIFEKEPSRYSAHHDVVKRVLAGEAPGNLVEIVTQYFGLTQKTWGKDIYAGNYPWIQRSMPNSADSVKGKKV